MKKEDHKQVGPGRPNQGKKAFTVTLTAEHVKKAKKRERNFSGLLDRLLSEFLGVSAGREFTQPAPTTTTAATAAHRTSGQGG